MPERIWRHTEQHPKKACIKHFSAHFSSKLLQYGFPVYSCDPGKLLVLLHFVNNLAQGWSRPIWPRKKGVKLALDLKEFSLDNYHTVGLFTSVDIGARFRTHATHANIHDYSMRKIFPCQRLMVSLEGNKKTG